MWTACKQDAAVTRFALLKNSYCLAEPLRCSLLRNSGNLEMNMSLFWNESRNLHGYWIEAVVRCLEQFLVVGLGYSRIVFFVMEISRFSPWYINCKSPRNWNNQTLNYNIPVVANKAQLREFLWSSVGSCVITEIEL